MPFFIPPPPSCPYCCTYFRIALDAALLYPVYGRVVKNMLDLEGKQRPTRKPRGAARPVGRVCWLVVLFWTGPLARTLRPLFSLAFCLFFCVSVELYTIVFRCLGSPDLGLSSSRGV